MEDSQREFKASIQAQIKFLKGMHKTTGKPSTVQLLPADSELRNTLSTLFALRNGQGVIKGFSRILNEDITYDELQAIRQQMQRLWDADVIKVFRYTKVVQRFLQYVGPGRYQGKFAGQATEWFKLLQFFPFKRLYLLAVIQENQGLIKALDQFYDSFVDPNNPGYLVSSDTRLLDFIAICAAFQTVMTYVTEELRVDQWQPSVYLLEQLIKAQATTSQVFKLFDAAEADMQKAQLRTGVSATVPCCVTEVSNTHETMSARSVLPVEPLDEAQTPAPTSENALQAIPWKSWLMEEWEESNGVDIRLVAPNFHIEINCNIQNMGIRQSITDTCRQLATELLFPIRPKVVLADTIQYIQMALTHKPHLAQDPNVAALDEVLKSTIGTSLIPTGIDKKATFDYKKVVEDRDSFSQRKVDIWVSRKYGIRVTVYLVISRESRAISDILSSFKVEFNKRFVDVHEKQLHAMYVASVVRACQEMYDNLSKPTAHLAVNSVLESLSATTREQVKKKLNMD